MLNQCGLSVAHRGFEMATRRTPLRRKRLGDAAELEAWRSQFETGIAFDGDVLDLGLWEASPDDFDRAARAAWNRLGETFMATWQPTNVRGMPWALETYGRPTDGN